MSLNNTTRHSNFKDRTGQRYGRLTVLEQAEIPPGTKTQTVFWRCLCDCGNFIVVDVTRLRPSRPNISCGCLHRERVAAMGSASRTHGMTNTPEYKVWKSMKARCYNPKTKGYANWGGRGITICDRWRESFENFYADMGPRPSPKLSIDRIDNDGPYSPDNCRWATQYEQVHNQRKRTKDTRVRLITYNGKTQSIAKWSRELGVRYQTLLWRISKGWDIERALTT